MRLNVYAAICAGVKGIVLFSAHFGSTRDYGLSQNPALLAYANELAREIRSFNDILVSKTISYKWALRESAPNTVVFSKRNIITLLGKTVDNWSYILKQYGNLYYLIVANKDYNTLADVNVSVPDLSGGAMTAKLIGYHATGSGTAGRTVTIQNGQFTDSFDGQAVHIYEIVPTDVPPPLPQQAPDIIKTAFKVIGGILILEQVKDALK